MTDMWLDEKVTRLYGEGGQIGLALFGSYVRIVDIVAAQMGSRGASQCSVSYSIKRWSLLMSLRGSLLRHYIEKMVVTGLVTAEWSDSELRVTIPNLLKYRDEYSKKSGDSPELSTSVAKVCPDKVLPPQQNDTFFLTSETGKNGTGAKREKVATSLEAATAEIADRIWERHPAARRCKKSTLQNHLRREVKTIPQNSKIKRMLEIDANHLLWCESAQWSIKGFVSQLGNWFTTGYCNNPPPSTESELPQQSARLFDGRKPLFE